jgi:hypothetical protein
MPPSSPYRGLPASAFWRTGVAERDPLDHAGFHRPRFPVSRSTRVATAGSCFAQHVGRALREAGADVIDAETLPPEVSDETARRFGHRLFSARYGNVYTARQLDQLLAEAEGDVAPAEPVWERDGRFFDAQRPAVEPDGLESPELVLRHRAVHLARVLEAFDAAEVFVFTFGLTEAWIHRETGTVYPTAPGTIAGAFDPEVHAFRNYDATEVLADFEAFRARLLRRNPGVRFLVTVSPVPLAATASGGHVEVATSYSKAVLRAVCGMLVERHEDVDYFPSYEVIVSQRNRGAFYEADGRSVTPEGVAAAMRLFLEAHGLEAPAEAPAPAARRRFLPFGREPAADADGPRTPGREARGRRRRARELDEQCEEALLESFSR